MGRLWLYVLINLMFTEMLVVKTITTPPDPTQVVADRILTIYAATMSFALANPAFTGSPPASAFAALDTAPDTTISATIAAGQVVFVYALPGPNAPGAAINLQRMTKMNAYAGLVAGGHIQAPQALGTIAAPGIPNGAAAIWGLAQ